MESTSHQSMIRYIYHISDIHIRNDRWDEYYQVFLKTQEKIRSMIDPKRSLIVITGDVLHFKTDLTPESVQYAKQFLDMMQKICDVVIIAGNHDCNMVNRSRIDSLTALFPLSHSDKSYLIEEKDHTLCYLRKSGHYQYRNILFGLSSLLDGRFVRARKAFGKYQIALHHGSKFSLQDFDGYDYVLLGHLHTPRFLAKNVGYSGSLIQQSFAESISNHGFLSWDLETGKTTFHEISNDYAFITIENTIPDLPPFIRLRIITDSISDISHTLNQIKAKTTILEFHRADKDLNSIVAPFTTITDHRSISWEITMLKFSNLFCYGENNQIRFDKYRRHESIGIVAPNRYGKSAIIDIILVCLFDRCKRGTFSQIMNKNKDTAKCSLRFVVGSVSYLIKRELINNKTCVRFYRYLGGKEDLTESCKTKTDAVIKQIVGKMNDYLITCVWIGSSNGFLDLTKSEKIRFVKHLVDAHEETVIEQKIKVTKALMMEYRSDNDIGMIEKRLGELQEISITDMFLDQIENGKSMEQLLIELTSSIAECKKILDDHKRYVHYSELYRLELDQLQRSLSETDSLIESVLPQIEAKANDFLRDLVSFEISLGYVNRDVIVRMVDGDRVMLVSQGSGFERFVVNLCLRVVWMQIGTFSKPDLFVIDEGWVCMDKKNRGRCVKIIERLEQICPRLILISHLPEIQEQMRHKIRIRQIAEE